MTDDRHRVVRLSFSQGQWKQHTTVGSTDSYEPAIDQDATGASPGPIHGSDQAGTARPAICSVDESVTATNVAASVAKECESSCDLLIGGNPSLQDALTMASAAISVPAMKHANVVFRGAEAPCVQPLDALQVWRFPARADGSSPKYPSKQAAESHPSATRGRPSRMPSSSHA